MKNEKTQGQKCILEILNTKNFAKWPLEHVELTNKVKTPLESFYNKASKMPEYSLSWTYLVSKSHQI